MGSLVRRVVDTVRYEQEEPIRSGTLFINPTTFEVFQGNRTLELTAGELKVLYILMKNHGRVVPLEVLERSVWGEDEASHDPVKRYVRLLRRKIGDDALFPRWIITVHRVGYRFMGLKPEFRDAREPEMAGGS